MLFRPLGRDRYLVAGENQFDVSGYGHETVSVNPHEQILALPGDLVGFRVVNVQETKRDHSDDPPNQTRSHDEDKFLISLSDEGQSEFRIHVTEKAIETASGSIFMFEPRSQRSLSCSLCANYEEVYSQDGAEIDKRPVIEAKALDRCSFYTDGRYVASIAPPSVTSKNETTAMMFSIPSVGVSEFDRDVLAARHIKTITTGVIKDTDAHKGVSFCYDDASNEIFHVSASIESGAQRCKYSSLTIGRWENEGLGKSFMSPIQSVSLIKEQTVAFSSEQKQDSKLTSKEATLNILYNLQNCLDSFQANPKLSFFVPLFSTQSSSTFQNLVNLLKQQLGISTGDGGERGKSVSRKSAKSEIHPTQIYSVTVVVNLLQLIAGASKLVLFEYRNQGKRELFDSGEVVELKAILRNLLKEHESDSKKVQDAVELQLCNYLSSSCAELWALLMTHPQADAAVLVTTLIGFLSKPETGSNVLCSQAISSCLSNRDVVSKILFQQLDQEAILNLVEALLNFVESNSQFQSRCKSFLTVLGAIQDNVLCEWPENNPKEFESYVFMVLGACISTIRAAEDLPNVEEFLGISVVGQLLLPLVSSFGAHSQDPNSGYSLPLEITTRLSVLLLLLDSVCVRATSLVDAEVEYSKDNWDTSQFVRQKITIETEHPYQAYFGSTITVTIPGAPYLQVQFSSKCCTNRWDDYVQLFKGPGRANPIGEQYKGESATENNFFPNQLVQIEGDTVVFGFQADSGSNYWGYRCVVSGPTSIKCVDLPNLLNILKTASWVLGLEASKLISHTAEKTDVKVEKWLDSKLFSGGITSQIEAKTELELKSPEDRFLSEIIENCGGGKKFLDILNPNTPKNMSRRLNKMQFGEKPYAKEVYSCERLMIATLLKHSSLVELCLIVLTQEEPNIPAQINHVWTIAQKYQRWILQEHQKGKRGGGKQFQNFLSSVSDRLMFIFLLNPAPDADLQPDQVPILHRQQSLPANQFSTSGLQLNKNSNWRKVQLIMQPLQRILRIWNQNKQLRFSGYQKSRKFGSDDAASEVLSFLQDESVTEKHVTSFVSRRHKTLDSRALAYKVLARILRNIRHPSVKVDCVYPSQEVTAGIHYLLGMGTSDDTHTSRVMFAFESYCKAVFDALKDFGNNQDDVFGIAESADYVVSLLKCLEIKYMKSDIHIFERYNVFNMFLVLINQVDESVNQNGGHDIAASQKVMQLQECLWATVTYLLTTCLDLLSPKDDSAAEESDLLAFRRPPSQHNVFLIKSIIGSIVRQFKVYERNLQTSHTNPPGVYKMLYELSCYSISVHFLAVSNVLDFLLNALENGCGATGSMFIWCTLSKLLPFIGPQTVPGGTERITKLARTSVHGVYLIRELMSSELWQTEIQEFVDTQLCSLPSVMSSGERMESVQVCLSLLGGYLFATKNLEIGQKLLLNDMQHRPALLLEINHLSKYCKVGLIDNQKGSARSRLYSEVRQQVLLETVEVVDNVQFDPTSYQLNEKVFNVMEDVLKKMDSVTKSMHLQSQFLKVLDSLTKFEGNRDRICERPCFIDALLKKSLESVPDDRLLVGLNLHNLENRASQLENIISNGELDLEVQVEFVEEQIVSLEALLTHFNEEKLVDEKKYLTFHKNVSRVLTSENVLRSDINLEQFSEMKEIMSEVQMDADDYIKRKTDDLNDFNRLDDKNCGRISLFDCLRSLVGLGMAETIECPQPKPTATLKSIAPQSQCGFVMDGEWLDPNNKFEGAASIKLVELGLPVSECVSKGSIAYFRNPKFKHPDMESSPNPDIYSDMVRNEKDVIDAGGVALVLESSSIPLLPKLDLTLPCFVIRPSVGDRFTWRISRRKSQLAVGDHVSTFGLDSPKHTGEKGEIIDYDAYVSLKNMKKDYDSSKLKTNAPKLRYPRPGAVIIKFYEEALEFGMINIMYTQKIEVPDKTKDHTEKKTTDDPEEKEQKEDKEEKNEDGGEKKQETDSKKGKKSKNKKKQQPTFRDDDDENKFDDLMDQDLYSLLGRFTHRGHISFEDSKNMSVKRAYTDPPGLFKERGSIEVNAIEGTGVFGFGDEVAWMQTENVKKLHRKAFDSMNIKYARSALASILSSIGSAERSSDGLQNAKSIDIPKFLRVLSCDDLIDASCNRQSGTANDSGFRKLDLLSNFINCVTKANNDSIGEKSKSEGEAKEESSEDCLVKLQEHIFHSCAMHLIGSIGKTPLRLHNESESYHPMCSEYSHVDEHIQAPGSKFLKILFDPLCKMEESSDRLQFATDSEFSKVFRTFEGTDRWANNQVSPFKTWVAPVDELWLKFTSGSCKGYFGYRFQVVPIGVMLTERDVRLRSSLAYGLWLLESILSGGELNSPTKAVKSIYSPMMVRILISNLHESSGRLPLKTQLKILDLIKRLMGSDLCTSQFVEMDWKSLKVLKIGMNKMMSKEGNTFQLKSLYSQFLQAVINLNSFIFGVTNKANLAEAQEKLDRVKRQITEIREKRTKPFPDHKLDVSDQTSPAGSGKEQSSGNSSKEDKQDVSSSDSTPTPKTESPGEANSATEAQEATKPVTADLGGTSEPEVQNPITEPESELKTEDPDSKPDDEVVQKTPKPNDSRSVNKTVAVNGTDADVVDKKDESKSNGDDNPKIDFTKEAAYNILKKEKNLRKSFGRTFHKLWSLTHSTNYTFDLADNMDVKRKELEDGTIDKATKELKEKTDDVYSCSNNEEWGHVISYLNLVTQRLPQSIRDELKEPPEKLSQDYDLPSHYFSEIKDWVMSQSWKNDDEDGKDVLMMTDAELRTIYSNSVFYGPTTYDVDKKLVVFVSNHCRKTGDLPVSIVDLHKCLSEFVKSSKSSEFYSSGSPEAVKHCFKFSTIVLRYAILKMLNMQMTASFRVFDLTKSDDTHNIAYKLVKYSDLIFSHYKAEKVYQLFEQFSGYLSSDQLQISGNRAKASISLEQGLSPEKCLQNSLLGQIMEQLSSYTCYRLRGFNGESTCIWQIKFVGEGSEDAGGPYRESISIMCADVLNPKLKLFANVPNYVFKVGQNREKFIPCPSSNSKEMLKYYRFLGILMGMAVRVRYTLPLEFPSTVWKYLIHQPLTIEDLEQVDKMAVDSMKSIKNIKDKGDVPFSSMIDETFSCNLSDGKNVELKENGSHIPVTFGNRDEFARLVIDVRLQESSAQLEEMRKGFGSIVPVQILRWFTWQEVEVLVCGYPEVNIEHLKTNTTYKGTIKENDPHILLFWRVLESFNTDERQGFLKFVWGRARLPLQKDSWSDTFKIAEPSNDATDASLPIAHTCFFTLDLPRYSTFDIMRARLLYALENCAAIDTDFDSTQNDAWDVDDE